MAKRSKEYKTQKEICNTSDVQNKSNSALLVDSNEVIKYFIGFAMGIVATIISNYFLGFAPLQSKIAVLEERSGNIQNAISEVNSQLNVVINSNAQNAAEIEATQKELSSLYNYVHINVINMSDSAVAHSLIDLSTGDKDESELASYSAEEIVGIGVVDGETYSAEQIIGVPALLIYEDNEYSVVFYGRYNSDYHWDGKCLINTYLNGHLEYISDSVYDNGKLVSSVDVYRAKVKKNTVDVWNIYDRVCYDDYNIGSIKSYYYSERIIDYKIEQVTMSDLLYPRVFENSLTTGMEGFYYGRTSGSWQNDDTGDAYVVKYDEQGYVRTLYVGKVKNGMFDDSGNALEIVFDTTQSKYFVYKGPFKSDQRVNRVNGKNYVEYSEIQNYISDKYFACPLKWNTKEDA